MKTFLDADFLLETDTARKLFHGVAEGMPIIDYHCHLSPAEIADDAGFSNITEAWLYHDHYKWRAMRECGIDEKYITGNGSDYEKFRAYCRCMPMLAGNPLYHWSHLELRRYFDCDLIINPENCESIWKLTSSKLAEGNMTARRLIRDSNVKLLCTTDDPADSLEYHARIAADGYGVKVLPAFRPDKIMNIDRDGICEYIGRLSAANEIEIRDLNSLFDALTVSLKRFEAHGCRTADHGMDDFITFAKPDPYNADRIFKKVLSGGEKPTADELALWKTELMRFFCKFYTSRGWVMQIHYGVLRNPNRKMFSKLGPDSGFDTPFGRPCVDSLASLLNYLECEDALPRTIIYSVNPADDQAVAALAGSFCRGDGSGIPTVTQGSAWWFNDNIPGMQKQLVSFASLAALGKFPGMLTDSRSFLSYPRHEYFRRIFCNYLGNLVENGEYPDDFEALSQIVRNVCYNNTVRLFGFEEDVL